LRQPRSRGLHRNIARIYSAHIKSRYLTASGDLILPKNFHEWVYVESPLSPNALNDGKANFPEFHNVYIEPGSYEIYKKANQLTLPGENPDGSRKEPSGRGYFPGALNGADVTVKDSKPYASTGGWALKQLRLRFIGISMSQDLYVYVLVMSPYWVKLRRDGWTQHGRGFPKLH
jgi:hypothetical protein